MNEWLDLTQEKTLFPEQPICDPHHHFWDHPQSRYLLDELMLDLNSGHNVVSTVFVECMSMYSQAAPVELSPVGETEFVQGIAAMSASGNYGQTRVAAGIVSYADLTLGDRVKPVLEAHIAASPNRFRGIRHAAGWDPDPKVSNSHTNPPKSLYMDDTFRAGFAYLSKYNLSFDAWFFHPQLDEFIDLVKNFPKTNFILDHFGGPLGVATYADKKEEVFKYWQERISKLGEYSNVYAKLGGINMKINGFAWHKRQKPPGSEELAEATARYYHHVIDSFGCDRCMFESNFPVDKASCSYNILWNTFKRISEGYDSTSRNALFHDTAARVYRLH